jgi:hypothetical protein
MLLPRPYAWTRKKRWRIVASVVVALSLFVTGVYVYERCYRGPGQEVLYGAWKGLAVASDDPVYLDFGRDGTFSLDEPSEARLDRVVAGKWYAAGKHIYLQFRAEAQPRHVVILHIVDITDNELRIRYTGGGNVYTYRRVRLHSSSHLTMR